MAQFCGQPVKNVLKDMERDFWMNAQEGVRYGIIDQIGDPMYESHDLSMNFMDDLQGSHGGFIFKTQDTVMDLSGNTEEGQS